MLRIENKQITFVDGRYYTDADGNHYPSATTILEAFPKPYALLQWMKEAGNKADEIRDAAGRRGSVVHHLTEQYDLGHEVSLLGPNGQPQYSLEEWGMLEKYIDFVTRFNPKYEAIEKTIVSKRLGFAGTIDRVGVIDGKRYIIDIKSSNGIYDTYWLQLAGYNELFIWDGDRWDDNRLDSVDGVAILWLNAKTRSLGKKGDIQGHGWQLIIKDNTDKEWELFKATKKIWESINEGAQPKSYSYQLKHKKNA